MSDSGNVTLHNGHLSAPYHYVPTFAVCVTFIVLFGLATLIHIGQAIYYRMWWIFGTAVCCGLGETIGWSGRLWSSLNPPLLTPFLMQISSTIMAPTFLVAANFIILGQIIRIVGPQYSRLGPNAYAIVFLTADSVALIVQAIGGAHASAALDLHEANIGAKIMLGGILFQFVAIVFYVSLASEFLVRFFTDRPLRSSAHVPTRPLPRRLALMVAGLTMSTVFIFIRTIYRTIELQEGWTGRIITTQRYYNWLDGMPITVAMYTLIVLHPGWLIPGFSLTGKPRTGSRETIIEKDVRDSESA